jgi:nucleotide-binding universal stress UspA family protein
VDTTAEVGGPANAIVECAEEESVDHIVTGSHGRSGVTRILLGSVAETVVRRSPVPVTVVR